MMYPDALEPLLDNGDIKGVGNQVAGLDAKDVA